MRNAAERRIEMLKYLCKVRHETRVNLMFMFSVSKNTIDRDIEALSYSYPIYTVSGRGGGIYVDEKFELGKEYLTEKQEELLMRLVEELSPEDASVALSILKKFGFYQRRRSS